MTRHSGRLLVLSGILLFNSLAKAQILHQDQEVEVHDLPSLVARTPDPSDILLTSLDTVFHDREICCGPDSALGDAAQKADPKSLRDIATKLEGRHLLSDGRPVQIRAEYLTPDAVTAGKVVSSIMNQQVPLIPAGGPTLGWARRMNTRCELSLQELARHLAGRTDMDDVVAIRVNVALAAAARSAKISRILSRFGFEIVPQRDSPTLARRINQFSENILVSLMVLARNAIALRRDTLVRDRVVAYLSRGTLEQRYGAGAKRHQTRDPGHSQSWL